MPLTRDDYEAYVRAFNARDYATLHGFFADDVVLEAHGFALRGKAQVREFYDTFHAHVRETVMINGFYECGEISIADATINFFGEKELRSSVMEAIGLPAGPDVPKGADFNIHYFILYESTAGLITRIRTGTYEPPV